MTLSRLFGTALITAMLSAVAVSTASSRNWKATPDAIARDYATINDARPGGELIEIPAEICEKTAHQYEHHDSGRGSADWPAYLRILDGVDRSYRD